MLQQHLLNYCQKGITRSLSHSETQNKSATREAQLVAIGIPMICLYSLEPKLIKKVLSQI